MKFITKYSLFVEKLGFKNFKDFILLVGPPGSGKSFYVNKLKKEKEYDIFNRDDIVIEIAEKEGLTYREAFCRPNYVLDKEKNYFIPKENDFYEINDKKYLKGYEKFGDVIELPQDSYLRRFSDTAFSKIMEINLNVEKTFNERLEKSIQLKHNIIIDMMNMNKFSRKVISKLGTNRPYYKVKAVVFNKGGVGMEDIILNINKKRDLELSKINREKEIPASVIKNSIFKFEEPTKDEDIDQIIHIDNKKDLENVLKL